MGIFQKLKKSSNFEAFELFFHKKRVFREILWKKWLFLAFSADRFLDFLIFFNFLSPKMRSFFEKKVFDFLRRWLFFQKFTNLSILRIDFLQQKDFFVRSPNFWGKFKNWSKNLMIQKRFFSIFYKKFLILNISKKHFLFFVPKNECTFRV